MTGIQHVARSQQSGNPMIVVLYTPAVNTSGPLPVWASEAVTSKADLAAAAGRSMRRVVRTAQIDGDAGYMHVSPLDGQVKRHEIVRQGMDVGTLALRRDAHVEQLRQILQKYRQNNRSGKTVQEVKSRTWLENKYYSLRIYALRTTRRLAWSRRRIAPRNLRSGPSSYLASR
jgi:hypothetical protein